MAIPLEFNLVFNELNAMENWAYKLLEFSWIFAALFSYFSFKVVLSKIH